MFDSDPETKRQSAEWHAKSSLRPKKARLSRSRVKTMIIVFSTAMALCTKNLYLKDKQLITPSTKMSWNDLENGSSGVHSEWTLQTTGCCTTITRQLALHFQFENFWRRKTFQYFHILKRDTLHTERGTCALPLYRCRCSEQVKTCLRITSWIVRWLCGGHR